MKNIIFSSKIISLDIASLLLRLSFGLMLSTHGYAKMNAYDRMLEVFHDYIGLGVPLNVNLVIFAEFICALLVAVGFLTRLAVIPIAIAMSVAAFVAHAGDPFRDKEMALMYLSLSVIIFILGSGKWSADRFLFKR